MNYSLSIHGKMEGTIEDTEISRKYTYAHYIIIRVCVAMAIRALLLYSWLPQKVLEERTVRGKNVFG